MFSIMASLACWFVSSALAGRDVKFYLCVMQLRRHGLGDIGVMDHGIDVKTYRYCHCP